MNIPLYEDRMNAWKEWNNDILSLALVFYWQHAKPIGSYMQLGKDNSTGGFYSSLVSRSYQVLLRLTAV